jgi:choline dehydrogenase-like flavoprotein
VPIDVKTRVCIVGSGVAGGVVAERLLDAGLKDLCMIETGPAMPMKDSRTWYGELTASEGPFKSPFRHLVPPASEFKNVGSHPFERWSVLRGRGGTTLHWDGWAFRLKPEDFRLRSNIGVGADWPISYDDLEPFYLHAERTLQVAGSAEDPGHPPRKDPFPLPAVAADAVETTFLKAMAELSFSTQHICIARNTRPINGMPQCQLTGTCRYCPLGARFTGDQLIDRIERRKGFRLLLKTSGLKLVFASSAKVRALEVLDQDSDNVYSIEAEHFVICGGAIGSAQLLLSSANPWWPEGVGNHHGHLGRFFFNHVTGGCYLVEGPSSASNARKEINFNTVISRHFDSPQTQANGKFVLSRFDDWPGLDQMMASGQSIADIREALQGARPGSLGFSQEQWPDEANTLTLGPGVGRTGLRDVLIRYSMNDSALANLKAVQPIVEKIAKQMGCREVKWERPGVAAHPMGICRMSKSPEDGVVDPNLKVHNTENLYVCTSGVFPTGGAVNPTLTIAALAHRLGAHLGSLFH